MSISCGHEMQYWPMHDSDGLIAGAKSVSG